MDRKEFGDWGEDLKRRFPDLSAYVHGLPKETRDVWFDDIFSPYELRDALAMNRQLFETGESIGKWDRDKLPSTFIKLLQDIAWNRNQREEKHKRDTRGAQQRVQSDPMAAKMNEYVLGKSREYRREHGEVASEATYRQWAREASERFDKSDEKDGPRYRCCDCQDTGYTSRDDGTVGCCLCELGRKRHEAWQKSGKRIAFAVPKREATDNQFNQALEDDDAHTATATASANSRDVNADHRAEAATPSASADSQRVLPAVQDGDRESDTATTQAMLDM